MGSLCFPTSAMTMLSGKNWDDRIAGPAIEPQRLGLTGNMTPYSQKPLRKRKKKHWATTPGMSSFASFLGQRILHQTSGSHGCHVVVWFTAFHDKLPFN